MTTKTRKNPRKTVQYPVFHRGSDVNDIKWIMDWFAYAIPFCVVTLVLAWSMHGWELISLADDDMQTLEVFVSVFGLAYAVVVGLLIVEAHGRWHSLSSAIRNELNAVSDIYDCLRYFHDSKDNKKARGKIRFELSEYVNRLQKYELELMSHSRAGSWKIERYMERWKENVEKRKYYKEYKIDKYNRIAPFLTPGIDKIIEEVKKLESVPEDTEYAKDKIVDKICDLTSWRANRLELAEGGLKGYLKFFLIFMSLIIVAGTMFLQLAEPWLHMFMVGAVTAGVVGLYMVLIDVDRPFSGYWKIDETLLQAIRDKLSGGTLKT